MHVGSMVWKFYSGASKHGFFFYTQKTSYDMRISDWSSDVCSSDLLQAAFRKDDAAPSHRRFHDEWFRMRRTGSAARCVGPSTWSLGQLRGGREAAPARSPTRQPNASILWAAGWGSGPVSPRKSLFRDFPNERPTRSEEHTSELQSLMRISYAVFCLKKKKQTKEHTNTKTN